MAEHAVILLAEDEEDYVLLVKKAFSEANIKNPLYVVSTGTEAMAYLKGEGKFANRAEYPLPDLLLLDIKLPGFSGLDIIKWARDQPGLAGLRIVVLTSSDQLKDVNDAYRFGANSFLMKPYDFHDLVHLSKVVEEFWLYMSKTPESFRPAKNQMEGGSPKKADESRETQPAARPSSNLVNRISSILIVEDNPLNAELATDLLEAGGFHVRLAGTAEAGIQMAGEILPDLILMDINLPGMDGASAAKILKSDPATRHLRIVGLTAHAVSGGVGSNSNFDGYLAKPIDTHTFVASVKAFIGDKAGKR
ncbi:MAG TPA: response regulator [Candidatus Angelobacter sp.]|nr:response regulator [Candidatus Angelobacter sp.]